MFATAQESMRRLRNLKVLRLATMRTVVCNDNNDRVCRLIVFVVKDCEGSDNIALDSE